MKKYEPFEHEHESNEIDWWHVSFLIFVALFASYLIAHVVVYVF